MTDVLLAHLILSMNSESMQTAKTQGLTPLEMLIVAGVMVLSIPLAAFALHCADRLGEGKP